VTEREREREGLKILSQRDGVRESEQGSGSPKECVRGRECKRVSKREGVREIELEGGSVRE